MIFRFLTLPIACLSLLSVSYAAPITWGPAVDTTGKSQLVEGTVVLAFSGGTAATVNAGGASGNSTYTFTEGDYTDLSFSPTPAMGTFIGDSPETGDVAFDTILKTFAFAPSTTSGNQTLTGLNLGQFYLIQLFFNDLRYPSRVMSFGDGEATPATASIAAGGSEGVGQHVVGYFTADGSTQTLTHAANGFASIHLSAILITESIIGPIPTLTTPAAAEITNPSFVLDIHFSESVTGLNASDFIIDNASVTAPGLTGSGDSYQLQLTATVSGDVRVNLPASSARATAGDEAWNLVSNEIKTNYTEPELPKVTLYSILTTTEQSYQVHLTFDELVTDLTTSDFQVVNGTATTLTGSGRYYSVTIAPAAPGAVEVSLPSGAVLDMDGDLQTNPDSNTCTTICTSDFGVVWAVDDASSWTTVTERSSNMTVIGGTVAPTADTASFTSIIKTFPVKKKARNVIFQQSAAWENWTASTGNLGPSGAEDAPVFVPAGPGDYYYLGKGPTDGYHAWHSTDMTNWVHKGPVTLPGSGRWVTSAEYMVSAEYPDGAYYIYSDYTNDHTPHLFIDEDLDDGVPGTLMGAALPRSVQAHGSDCSIIRNDEDGFFHLIYEDWSPINASSHSWDSPLAGHTSSADGFTGFVEDEHQPPVDHRTTPTGTFATYHHPDYPGAIYEIHTPEQNAYGDWTTIKIGSRFFMFSDFHPAGQNIRLARFASDSLYEEFEFTGSMHDGHPDPSVGFAEGRFYLFTQQSTDYTSPGPWVDGVESRAGVDVDGNGTIDEWTAWQAISEQYDYTPEYIRVVTLTPAQIDLSGLSAGYGFQYEFRVDNTVVPGISPIMNRVEVHFEPSHFQVWSNTNGVPFEPAEDANGNSIPNLIEFTLGCETLPQLNHASGELIVPITSGALEDGYATTLWFSENLLKWEQANNATTLMRLLSQTVLPNGDVNHVFGIISHGEVEHLFWYLEVTEAE